MTDVVQSILDVEQGYAVDLRAWLKGTDNRDKGTDNRDKGTDNRDKRTHDRKNGTDNRDKGTDNRGKGTDNRDKGTDDRKKGTEIVGSAQKIAIMVRISAFKARYPAGLQA